VGHVYMVSVSAKRWTTSRRDPRAAIAGFSSTTRSAACRADIDRASATYVLRSGPRPSLDIVR